MWKFLNGQWMLFAPDNEGAGGEPEAEETEEVEDEGSETEAEEPEEGTDEPGQTAEPRRGESRVQKLANETRTERDARIKAETERDFYKNQVNQPRNNSSAEAAAVRQAKLELMEPGERKVFLLEEQLGQVQQQNAYNNMQQQDFRDEARYDAVASTDTNKGRSYAKYKDEVETLLTKMRSNGNDAKREALVQYLIGRDALAAADKPKAKTKEAKAAATKRVETSNASSLSGRGGDRSGKGSGISQSDLEKRILDREARGEAR